MIIKMFDIANIVFYVLFGIAFLLMAFRVMLHLIGCGKAKKFPEAKENHKYGIIIPARNESKVIGQLLNSIKKQDYPQDKLDIFVIVENMNDPTVDICKDFENVEVVLRQHLERKGKGYALDECFSKILKEQKEKEEKYEAFFIFDADNILDKEYIKEMNKCFDAGYEVGCGYRNNKNWNDNWVSACSGLVFTVFSTFKNKPKAKLGFGVQVSGTGFYISADLIEKLDGWKFNTLTEDYEFTLSSLLNNYKSTYNEKAIFYDEQPTSLKVSWKQRVRWCKGFNQAGKIYNSDLFKESLKVKSKRSFDLFDSSIAILPLVVSVATLIVYGLFNLVLFIVALCLKNPMWYWPMIAFLGVSIGFYLLIFLYTAFIFIVDRKKIKIKPWRAFVACLTNPLFVSLYLPIVLQATFTRNVEWVPIAHTKIMTEEQ
ncbi:MAG: glycosyltransferase [Clostridia bacterium]|nr:glycosyltransferase [Clostridia bacterium]